MTIKILAISISLAFASCSNGQEKNATNQTEQTSIINEKLDCDNFEKGLDRTKVQLIDVRTPNEYAGGHIGNAANININDGSFEQKIAELDKSKPVYVYCASGGRSGKAASYLNSQGFQEVYDLKGGITQWNAEGKKIEK